MKSKEEIINELRQKGISIIENYYDLDYCKKAINEINNIISINKEKVVSIRTENTSGDERIFKIENQSKSAKYFKNDSFIENILQSISKRKIESYFILGGKLKASQNIIKNSGGGWHRDSDNSQFKSMLYLNDVDEFNGPFLFIQNSKQFDVSRKSSNSNKTLLHKFLILIGKMKSSSPRYEDKNVQKFLNKNKIIPLEIRGKAGTLILFNGSYIHRGKNIEKGARYSFTNYFFNSNIKTRYFRNKQFKNLFIKEY